MRWTLPVAVIAILLGCGPALAAESCVLSWPMLKPAPQKFYKIETPDLPANIVALRFGPLEGEFPKLFIFLLDGDECFVKAVVAGSYAATTKGARNAGEIGPEDRMYHLDLYDGASHVTLGFSKVPYTFEQVRDAALRFLK